MDGGLWAAKPQQMTVQNALAYTAWAFCVSRSGFADHPKHGVALRVAADKGVPGLVAKMGHVDDGCRIIRQHPQFAARRKPHQALARLENGQGAQQPGGIQIFTHTRDLGLSGAAVHSAGAMMAR